MNIIIVGCGKVGVTLAEKLSQEEHDITVIDTNREKVTEITNRLDLMGYVGNGASFELLREAGIEGADLFIAATDQDEINLLCCLFARQAGKCSTIARVRNPQYRNEITYIKEELGLAMVLNPDYDAAMEIARILRFPSANNVDTFAKGRVELLRFEIKEESFLAHKSLIEIGKSTKSQVLICMVLRNGEVIIPNGQFVIEPGDTIGVICTPESAREFFKKVGYDTHQVKNAMIIGGSRMAYYLANQLINSGISVKIIERERAKCETLSELLPKATIICGDATNEDVLLEEGLESVESFISLTGMDEGNIFLSLYSKSVSKAKVITKINKLEASDIVKNFALGSVVTPKNISSDLVVSYARAKQSSLGSNVETMYRMENEKIEVLEFKITNDASIVGIPVEELKLKDNLLLGCVTRKSRASIVNGKTVLEPGDTLIVITTNKGYKDIKDIIKA